MPVVAYRNDERALPTVAPTLAGQLTVEVSPTHVRLESKGRAILIAESFVTVIDRKKRDRRTSWRIEGRLIFARHVPCDDLGVWVESEGGMFCVFEAAPAPLLSDDGLNSFRAFDRVAQSIRTALRRYAGNTVNAIEVGKGLDKVLLVDTGDSLELYSRPLFRDRAKLLLRVNQNGTVTVANAKRSVKIKSRYGVAVQGDYIRFFDEHGIDLSAVSVPWILPEDRRELARRIGDLLDHQHAVQALALASHVF